MRPSLLILFSTCNGVANGSDQDQAGSEPHREPLGSRHLSARVMAGATEPENANNEAGSFTHDKDECYGQCADTRGEPVDTGHAEELGERVEYERYVCSRE